MTDEMVKADGLGQLAERVRLTKAGLAIEKEQRRLLNEFVRDCMVLDTDYGKIPGTDKPTLLKPGAEKLVDLFRCTPEFILEQAVTDFDKPLFYYRFKVRLFSEAAGRVLAEGVGSANSREARYRWRNGGRKCPSCGKETIIPGKAEYGGGWLCFGKKGGCGTKFKKGDQSIEGQQVGRVENDDIADLDNTILKMAKKRALVDGAIALARCSDLFTQDLEDLHEYRPREPPPEKEPHSTGAYGPPEGMPANEETAEAQFSAATAQVTGSTVPADTHVSFGPAKGKAIRDLSDPELTRTIDLGTNKLKEQPRAKWARAMRLNLAAMEAEWARRQAGAPDAASNAEEPTPSEMAQIRALEEAST
jgi:hypothetical protein